MQTYTCPVAESSLEIASLPLAGQHPAERERLERRARLLAVGGIAYHFVEFAIALGAGIAAGSIALIGFGADSLIEAFAGFVPIGPTQTILLGRAFWNAASQTWVLGSAR